jgi:hypothetical protein
MGCQCNWHHSESGVSSVRLAVPNHGAVDSEKIGKNEEERKEEEKDEKEKKRRKKKKKKSHQVVSVRRLELVDDEFDLLPVGVVGRRESVERNEDAEEDEDAERRQRRQRELGRPAELGSRRLRLSGLSVVLAVGAEGVVEEGERQKLESG